MRSQSASSAFSASGLDDEGGDELTDAGGERLPDEDADRVRSLVIPPAWRDVWVTPYENGHLQAVGTDDAGRPLQKDEGPCLCNVQGLPSALERMLVSAS